MVTNIKHITLVQCLDTFQRTYVKYLNRVYIFNFRNQQKMKMSDAYGSTFSGATYHRASDESQITREPIGFCRIFTREKMGSQQFLLQQFYFFNCLRRQRRALKVSIYFERGGGISCHQGDFLIILEKEVASSISLWWEIISQHLLGKVIRTLQCKTCNVLRTSPLRRGSNLEYCDEHNTSSSLLNLGMPIVGSIPYVFQHSLSLIA